MTSKPIMIAALMSAFLGFSTTAWAGPYPGHYKGKNTRTASPLAKATWKAEVHAENPTDPSATFSTHVTSTSSKGTTEALSYSLDVLDDGSVHADMQGKIKIGSKVYQFTVTGMAEGTFTEHSFATEIKGANISVRKVGSKKWKSGKTNLSVFAGSSAEGKIEVTLVAKPSTVLDVKYKVDYKGEAVP